MTGKKEVQKYYAVSNGRKPGIYTTWNQASLEVTGYPGASHKAYESFSEAKMAMQQAGHATPEIFDGETQRADERENDKSLVMNEDLQNEEVTANNDDTIANTTTLDNTVTDAECPCGERKASNGSAIRFPSHINTILSFGDLLS
ncbi:hypothetical protein ACOMHN_029027 [Nucella lapillus]